MLEVKEFLDITAIEKIRLKCSGKGLDDHDNFSWHIALSDGGEIIGVARLYKEGDFLLLDKPMLPAFVQSHFEMLFRTLLLKAETSGFKRAAVREVSDYYLQFGFEQAGDKMIVDTDKIKFPKLCGGKCGGIK